MKEMIKNVQFISNFIRWLRETLILFSKGTYLADHNFYFSGSNNQLNGSFEAKEIVFFKKKISDFDLFVNVGANYGFYVCLALTNQKKVLAFEPMQRNLKVLTKNILNNNLEKNLILVPVALADTEKLSKIYGSGTGASLHLNWNSQRYFSVVPTLKLDNFSNVIEKYTKTLIMIDVEGFESMVLKGANNILASERSISWIIEISCMQVFNMPDNYKDLARDTFKILQKNGYNFNIIDSDVGDCMGYDEIYTRLGNQDPKIPGHNFYFFKEH